MLKNLSEETVLNTVKMETLIQVIIQTCTFHSSMDKIKTKILSRNRINCIYTDLWKLNVMYRISLKNSYAYQWKIITISNKKNNINNYTLFLY